MKKLVRNIDKKTVFWDDEFEKALKYYEEDLENPEECETLEDIAREWNRLHSGDAIGEMLVIEVED